MRNNRKRHSIKYIIINHLSNNKKEYIIITILFIIGVFLGVLVVNNTNDEKFNDISNYINNFTEKIKTTENVNDIGILKNSILKNIFITLTIWFFGTTVIRNSSCIWNFCV